jgi:hypothetical protein
VSLNAIWASKTHYELKYRIAIGALNPITTVRIWTITSACNVIPSFSRRIFLVAMLARLDQSLRLAESCGLDEHHNLLFWCWVEEVAGHWNRILGF